MMFRNPVLKIHIIFYNFTSEAVRVWESEQQIECATRGKKNVNNIYGQHFSCYCIYLDGTEDLAVLSVQINSFMYMLHMSA